MINWSEAEKTANAFSPMAEPGIYKAKIETIDVRETKNAQGNTSYWLDFLFVDDGIKFPKISHPISRKNLNWCAWHFMSILKELGIAEDKAKKAIEMAEDKSGVDNIIAGYHAAFDRATQKHPEVEIEVYEDDKINPNSGRPYMRADFKNPKIGFGNRTAKKAVPSSGENILDEGEPVDLTDESLPF